MNKYRVSYLNKEGRRRERVLWLSAGSLKSAENHLNEGGEWGVEVKNVSRWRSRGLGREGVGNPKKYA